MTKYFASCFLLFFAFDGIPPPAAVTTAIVLLLLCSSFCPPVTCFSFQADASLASSSSAENFIGNSNDSFLQSPHQQQQQHRTHLIFPGGGIFFYWQAGVVTYLRDHNYNLDVCTMTGASAGALTATLTATNVDFYKATDLALAMAKEAGVWDRGSLQGIWGPLIENWLYELLSDESAVHDASDGRLSLLLTPVPRLFETERICNFHDKDDLIRCNMASVHLPWFLDSKLTQTFRDRPYIDGSFLSRTRDYEKESANTTLVVDYNHAVEYQNQGLLSFVDLVSAEGIYKMLEDGKQHAKSMEEQGMFEKLQKHH
jgi:predicted acylesterase/phospholipase RssA